MKISKVQLKKIASAWAKGEWYDFKGQSICVLDFRELWLKFTSLADPIEANSQVCFKIRGAHFAERLLLSKCTATGGGELPGLALEDCLLDRGLDLSGSIFALLEINRCTIGTTTEEPSINLREARFRGSLKIEYLSPFETEPAGEPHVLWVDAHHVRIDGDLVIRNSKFCAPAARKPIGVDRYRYALCFDDLTLSGSVIACPGVIAEGGVTFKNANIGQDVWLLGARLNAGEAYALNGQSIKVGGALMLGVEDRVETDQSPKPFVSVGTLWLLGATVGSDLHLAGARLLCRFRDNEGALVLSGSVIGRNMTIRSFDKLNSKIRPIVFGNINLNAATIHGSCLISEASCAAPWPKKQSLSWFDADAANIQSDLIFSNCSPIKKMAESEYPTEKYTIIDAENFFKKAQIDYRSNDPINAKSEIYSYLIFSIFSNRISLNGSKISSFQFYSEIKNPYVMGPEYSKKDNSIITYPAISLRDARIENNITISAEVMGDLDFSGADISAGSVKLDGLRLAPFRVDQPCELRMKDCDIAKSITVKTAVDRSMRVVAARGGGLLSIPGKKFVEALLYDPTDDSSENGDRYIMRGYILDDPRVGGRGVTYRSKPQKPQILAHLDGGSIVFHKLRDSGELYVDDQNQAEEFLRLFTGYVQGEEGAFRIVTNDLELDCVQINEEKSKEYLADLSSELLSAIGLPDDDDSKIVSMSEITKKIEKTRTFIAAGANADIATVIEPIKITEQGDGSFKLEASLIYGNQVFRSQFVVNSKNGGLIEMIGDDPRSPPLNYPIEYRGRSIRWTGSNTRFKDGFPLPPTLLGMKPITGVDLETLEKLLNSSADFGRAVIDLRDTCCDTLDDDGGSAWGADTTLKLNRFTYRQSVDINQADQTEPKLRWLRSIFHYLGLLGPLFRMFPRSTRQWLGGPLAVESWNARFNWLMQQYPRAIERGRPAIKKIEKEDYRPQPFDHAIRTAEAAGDYETANELHIKKNRIEGHIRAKSIQGALLWVALAATAGLLFMQQSFSVVTLSLTVFTFVLIWRIADIAQLAIWLMFGYLAKPVRAVVTLISFVVIGSIGVHFANVNDRLVVDLLPTASVVGGEGVAAPISDNARRGIRCGAEINEVLYAIDVFIPLIDLRQESRCSVGKVDEPITNNGMKNEFSAARESGMVRAGYWESAAYELEARTLSSTSFWSTMKSIYGILGWIVISLSILTFTRSMRRPMEM